MKEMTGGPIEGQSTFELKFRATLIKAAMHELRKAHAPKEYRRNKEKLLAIQGELRKRNERSQKSVPEGIVVGLQAGKISARSKNG